jgi:hypothetical protein
LKQTYIKYTIRMKIIHLVICLTLVSLASCKSDESKKASLNGRWDLKYAELNGQPAPSLERIYFDFNNGNVTTNFNEATTDETTSFDLKKQKIIKNSQPKIELSIQNQTDSVLELTTEMRGFDFKLILVRGLIK